MIQRFHSQIFLLFLALSFAKSLYSQNVNATTYPLSVSSGAILEDMSAATVAITSGSVPFYSAPTIPFGDGFEFCLDGVCYDSLTINSRCIIRLGTEFSSSMSLSTTQPEIAPMNCTMGTGINGNVKYQLLGTAPNRKFVVHWKVNMQSTSTIVAANHQVQLWLHENGRIDFVYGATPATWTATYRTGFSYGNISNGVFGKVLTDMDPILANTTADYSGSIPNQNVVITSGSMISYIPDTMQVYLPPVIVSSASAACIEFEIQDTMTNEFGIKVFKALDGINYDELIKEIDTNTPGTTDVYIVKDSLLNSLQTYYYGVVSYGLGTVPDTTYLVVSTTAPSLSGIKTIPGDYSTITQALQEIRCDQLAGHLILELENTYDPNNEILPIVFDQTIYTSLTASLTIRPASGSTNIQFHNGSDTTVFEFDKASHIVIDGRPGGIGTNNELILFQDNSFDPAVLFKDSSWHNIVRNTQIFAKGKFDVKNNSVIFFDSTNNCFNVIEACILSPLTNEWLEHGIYSNGSLIHPNEDNSVIACQIIDFGHQNGITNDGSPDQISAIHLKNGNDSWKITANSFYFTDTLFSLGTDFLTINCPDQSGFEIKDNWFGGNEVQASGGQALIQVHQGDLHYISLSSDSSAQSMISGNVIKNLDVTVIASLPDFDAFYFIQARSNNLAVLSNMIGDTMQNSITITNPDLGTVVNPLVIIFVDHTIPSPTGTNYMIDSNYISGIKLNGRFHLKAIEFWNPFYAEPSMCKIRNNKIGGGLAGLDCQWGSTAIRIETGIDSVFIENNIISRVSGNNGNFCGISIYSNLPVSGIPKQLMFIRNNSIFDCNHEKIIPGLSVPGSISLIGIHVFSQFTRFTISGNNIYNLHSDSPTQSLSSAGIFTEGYATVGHAIIERNFIHNIWNKGNHGEMYGMRINFGYFRNNMISLGTNDVGEYVMDSCRVVGMFVAYSSSDSSYIEHNSIYVTADTTADTYINSMDDASSLYLSTSSGESGHAYIRNNIIVNNKYNNIVKYPPGYVDYCDYNQYYNGRNDLFGYLSPIDELEFSEWQTIYGMDLHSFHNLPMFLNPDAGGDSCDLHLQYANYAESNGIASSIYIDFDQDDRLLNSPVDIGADAGNFHLIPNLLFSADTITICSGDTLYAPSPAPVYDSYLWNLSETTMNIEPQNTGLYYLQIIDSLGYESTDSIFVYLDTTVPNLTSIADQILCEGDTIFLETSDGYTSYLWNTLDTTYDIQVYAEGLYHVKVANINGCSSFDTVLVQTDNLYAENYSDTFYLCQGDSILLTVSPVIYDFLWNQTINNDSLYLLPGTTNALTTTSDLGCTKLDTVWVFESEVYITSSNVSICDGDSILIFGNYQNTTGIYSQTFQSLSGCDSTHIFDLLVNTLPIVQLIASNGDDTICETESLIVLNGTPLGGLYSGTGLTMNLFDPAAANPGLNTLVYTYVDANFCESSDSLTYFVESCELTGLSDSKQHSILVYPNPANAIFYLEHPDFEKALVSIRVRNSLGQELLYVEHIGTPVFLLDLSGFSKGIYYVEIRSGDTASATILVLE